MKKLILIAFYLFLLPACAQEKQENTINRLEDVYPLHNLGWLSQSDVSEVVNFVPTDEMRKMVMTIKDPTKRMLNHTFWRMTTPAEVRELIKGGVDIDQSNRFHMLDYAIFSGKSELVWAVLDAGPDTNYAIGSSDEVSEPYTPLMLAVTYFPNDLAMLKRIVSLGCDPNWLCSFITVLSYAESASPEVLKYLLSVMNPSLRFHSKTFWKTATPADVLREIKNGADAGYALFFDADRAYTPLWYALQYSSNYDSIQTLINAGGTKLDAKITYEPEHVVEVPAGGFRNMCVLANEGMPEFIRKNKIYLGNALDGSFKDCPEVESILNSAIVIDTTGLNIREEANAHSTIVGEPLPEGSIVEITGDEQGNWVPISYQGRSGFVYKTLIEPYLH